VILDGAGEFEEEDCGISRFAFLRGVLFAVSASASDSESEEAERARAARLRFPFALVLGVGVVSLLWAGGCVLLVVRSCSYCGA
jgi:hypothetical protein